MSVLPKLSVIETTCSSALLYYLSCCFLPLDKITSSSCNASLSLSLRLTEIKINFLKKYDVYYITNNRIFRFSFFSRAQFLLLLSRLFACVWMLTDVPDWFNERFVPKKSTIARFRTGSWHTLLLNRSEEQNQKLPPLMFSHRLCLSRRRFLRSSVNTLGFG